MQLTFDFDPAKKSTETATILRRLAWALESRDEPTLTQTTTTDASLDVAQGESGVAVTTARRGRPRKEAVAADDTESHELGDDLPTGDDLDEDGAEEVTYTMTDVLGGFQTYVKKHSKEKAMKLLTKAGVKSVRDIPPTKFAEVMGWLSK